MNLQSLDNIFEKRILRIPDYQRGYSWQENQLEDFWEDLQRLDFDKVHYTGVVTLEPVKEKIWKGWQEDVWLINGRGFKAFYIVDGQQRITTSIILIQVILESAREDSMINYQSLGDIENHYILNKAYYIKST